MRIKLLDVVAVTEDLPEQKLRRGFEVEFTDNDGRTHASLALRADQLMVLHYQPVEAA